MMKVYHFNSFYNGGASIASRRIFKAVQSFSDSSYYMFLNYKNEEESWINSLGTDFNDNLLDKLKGRLYWKRRNKLSKLGYFSIPFYYKKTAIDFSKPPFNGKPDLIHLHWVSESVDLKSFLESIPNDIPIIWTLHDVNPFTGGCHVLSTCVKYKTGCGNCPSLSDNMRDSADLSSKIVALKRELLKNRKLAVAANSLFIENAARESIVFKNSFHFRTIYHPMDLENEYFPIDKHVAKNALGVDDKEFVILFMSYDLNNKDKGFETLNNALKKLHIDKNITLLLCGKGKVEVSNNVNKVINMGFVSNPYFTRLVYSASDVHVQSSVFESFGQTVVESLACGTPVIASKVGGMLDTVIHEYNGYHFEVNNSIQLSEYLQKLAIDKNLLNMLSANARPSVVDKFSIKSHQEKMKDLYELMLKF